MLAGGEESFYYLDAATICDSKRSFADLLRGWLVHPDRRAVLRESGPFGGKPLVRASMTGEDSTSTGTPGTRECVSA